MAITATHTEYNNLDGEINDYSLMIHGRNCIDQLVKNDKRRYVKILKITNVQGDHYTTACYLECL